MVTSIQSKLKLKQIVAAMSLCTWPKPNANFVHLVNFIDIFSRAAKVSLPKRKETFQKKMENFSTTKTKTMNNYMIATHSLAQNVLLLYRLWGTLPTLTHGACLIIQFVKHLTRGGTRQKRFLSIIFFQKTFLKIQLCHLFLSPMLPYKIFEKHFFAAKF